MSKKELAVNELPERIIQELRKLRHTDRDIRTLAVLFNPNYKHYSSKEEKTVLVEILQYELNRLVEKGQLNETREVIKVVTRKGEKKDRTFTFYDPI